MRGFLISTVNSFSYKMDRFCTTSRIQWTINAIFYLLANSYSLAKLTVSVAGLSRVETSSVKKPTSSLGLDW